MKRERSVALKKGEESAQRHIDEDRHGAQMQLTQIYLQEQIPVQLALGSIIWEEKGLGMKLTGPFPKSSSQN